MDDNDGARPRRAVHAYISDVTTTAEKGRMQAGMRDREIDGGTDRWNERRKWRQRRGDGCGSNDGGTVGGTRAH